MAYMGVTDVEYFEHELMPGRAMFRCVKLAASLQVEKCAEMWRASNAPKPAGCERCQRCAIGAVHAGEGQASMSPIRASGMCSRTGCNRTDQRLIGGLICVSCYNRQAEVLKGRNAKGKVPVKHPPLERRCVRYVVDGQVRRLSRPHTVATDELVIELLRDSPKRVMIGRGIGQSGLRQGVLA